MSRSEVNRRNFLLGVGGSALAAAAVPGVAAAQSGSRSRLQIYALPSRSGAMLHLSVLPDSGHPAPSVLRAVEVAISGPDGHPRWRKTFTDVSASSGSAVLELGSTSLLDTVSARVVLPARNSRQAQVLRGLTRVTAFALHPRDVLVPDFQGYGGQMNMHLYTALNDPDRGFTGNVPPEDVGNVEAKVIAMKPALVRIFLSPQNYLPENQNRMDSFVKTVELAERAGSAANITWWYLDRAAGDDPEEQQRLIVQDMSQFAGTLVDLVVNRGLTTVQQITIQNEVNTTWIQPELYEQCYRLLDTYLQQAGIRDRIAFVGGDLVYNNQTTWFNYMADNMGDVLQGWSVHIYWNYWDTAYMMSRLSDISGIYAGISPEKRKPLSITEYGVRGIKLHNNDPKDPILDVNPYRNGALTPTAAGYYQDGDGVMTPISETNISAFQQAWFNIQATTMGFSGLAKWDLYRAQYDFSYQDHSAVGYLFDPAPGEDRWPLRPLYHVQSLMANTTGTGWQVLSCDGGPAPKLITAFAGPAGDLTLFALSTDGAAATFSVGDLPADTEFNVVFWNKDGAGTLSAGGVIDSGPTGTVSFDAAGESLVCLTTIPIDAVV